MLLIKLDELDLGMPMLAAAVDELRRARYVQYDTAFLAALTWELRTAMSLARLRRRQRRTSERRKLLTAVHELEAAALLKTLRG